MGEDRKPEAQLIKQVAPKSESSSSEKKKVVVAARPVVKKRVVVKKVDKTDEKKEPEKKAVKLAKEDKETKEAPAKKKENIIPPSIREDYLANKADQEEKPSAKTAEEKKAERLKNINSVRTQSGQTRRVYTRKAGETDRPPYQRRDGSRPSYQRREDSDSRPPYQRREDSDSRPPYQRREGGGTRPPFQRRDGQQGARPRGSFNQGGEGGNRRFGTQGGRPGQTQGARRGFTPNNRFSSGRPTGGAGAAPTMPLPEDGKKRVFKAKKKTTQEKKTRNQEINFQLPTRKRNTTNPIPKSIDIMEVITVSDLAKKMNLKSSDLISKLMEMGMMVTINQQIDSDTASILASEFGCEVNVVSLYDETLIEGDKADKETYVTKAPVITVMGHVDHGKTKLLDAIRASDTATEEYGGITQHIGAYKVRVKEDKDIVLLDTPGHAAFTLMRARGAQVTDIVVLVVAANDGVMPQTKEAVAHAKDAGVPIIVAINKIDLPEANPDRVKQQLSELGLMPEEWGGDTLFCHVSALRREGLDGLIDAILLQAELLELEASADMRAEGKVIEARVDHGRGIVATVLIEKGTIHVGDPFVAGIYFGKVRALFDDRGEKIDSAGPSTPIEILGFSGVPAAGSPFQVTETERLAKNVSEKRVELEKHGEAKNVKKITLDNLYDSIQDGEMKELKVIVKGDVVGSVEAITSALEKLSTSEIRLNVIQAGVGAIVDNDVTLADASNAIIIGFHVRPTPQAQALADENKIEIKKYHVIYDIVEDVIAAMEGLLDPEYSDVAIGTVEVRDTFKVPKIGLIAGCYVTSGVVKRNSRVHVIRDNIEIHTGPIESLRRFKDEAREVREGFECGIGLRDFHDIKEGDIMEVFEVKETKRKLDQSGVII